MFAKLLMFEICGKVDNFNTSTDLRVLIKINSTSITRLIYFLIYILRARFDIKLWLAKICR